MPIDNIKQLTKTVTSAIDHTLPLIIHYDRRPGENGDSAHYAVIVGYKKTKRDIQILISQNNTFELHKAKNLFAQNDSLNYWHAATFIKAQKTDDYEKLDQADEGIPYKSITEPNHNLSKTLKHKLLLVFPKNKRQALEEDSLFTHSYNAKLKYVFSL